MAFNSSNIVAWHGATTAQHVAARDDHAARGFRPLSLSLHGTPASPRYTAVMVKRSTVIATRSVINLTWQQYQDTFNQMVADGFGPFLISATGPQGGAIYAGSFRPMSAIPFTRHDLSGVEFVQVNAEQKNRGRILLWADSFGTASNPRYCGIWTANPGKVAWNLDAVDEGGATLQQRFLAMRSVGARPALVSVTPAGRLLEMFVDSGIGSWDAAVGMTEVEYQARSGLNREKGLWPVCVSAAGSGAGTRYAAIFATRETTSPRTFRGNGTPAVPSIDAAMRDVMERRNLRGAALAVGQGTRLLFARGYTLAEASYPTVRADTFFRQASISKLYCAAAVWRLIQEGRLTLDRTLQSVLGLTRPDGSPPRDARFWNITIQHLLESRSGLPQGWNRAVEAANAAGTLLPANGMQMARWVADQMLTGDPGLLNNTAYGNVDYIMLSLVVQTITGSRSFEEGLGTLVLQPLKMTRTRSSRSLAGDQAADEARHHVTVHNPTAGWPLRQLDCGESVRDPLRPLVPTHYGTWDFEMMDGTGGLSASVVDVARLCAMLANRRGNPVLSTDSLDALFAAAATSTRDQRRPNGDRSHGYHGLDRVEEVDAGANAWAYGKGGWLPGLGTSLTGTTGGFFYVFAQNGNTPPDAGGWIDGVEEAVEAHPWGDGDLFPEFGMPSLGGIRRVGAETFRRVAPLFRDVSDLVEVDMRPGPVPGISDLRPTPPRPPSPRIPRRR